MRRNVPRATVLTLIPPLAGALSAQEASKILEQCLKAAGGSKTLGKVQTFALDGAVHREHGDSAGTDTFRVKLPNRL